MERVNKEYLLNIINDRITGAHQNIKWRTQDIEKMRNDLEAREKVLTQLEEELGILESLKTELEK